MDSDAYFQNISMGLPALERIYGDGRTPSADVMFSWDRPFSYGPNAGVQFWRNTVPATRLLALWWNLPGGRFHLTHDYEQHTLQWRLQALHSFRHRSARIYRVVLTWVLYGCVPGVERAAVDAREEHAGMLACWHAGMLVVVARWQSVGVARTARPPP